MGTEPPLRRGREVNLWRGLAAGTVAGIVASWVMNQFQSLLSKQLTGTERSHGAQSMQQGSPEGDRSDGDDDATERLAERISENLFERKLTETEKSAAGTAIHYAFGAVTGGFYGAVAEVIPAVTVGAGLPLGVAVWAVADEGVVPALGLSKSTREYPPEVHAYSLASHIVFGLTTELVRRAIQSGR